MLWTLAIACLLAATGVQVRTAEPEPHGAHAQLGDRGPALPAVTAPQHATLVVASRRVPPAGPHPRLPLVVLAAPPAPLGVAASRIADAARRCEHRASAALPTRCARGPPVC
jgi:hypothetical protein